MLPPRHCVFSPQEFLGKEKRTAWPHVTFQKYRRDHRAMFELLVQVHYMRGAMLSGPSCESGEFMPSDNWIGNNDADNKLAKQGVNLDSFGLDAALPLQFADHCRSGNIDNAWQYNENYLLGAN